jgi:hypothetical protein
MQKFVGQHRSATLYHLLMCNNRGYTETNIVEELVLFFFLLLILSAIKTMAAKPIHCQLITFEILKNLTSHSIKCVSHLPAITQV